MQHDWFMYHLRSTYKNRPDFPFKQCSYYLKSARKLRMDPIKKFKDAIYCY